MTYNNKTKIPRYEKCPSCNADITLKHEQVGSGGSRLVLYNPNGSKHSCDEEWPTFEKHPIGQAMIGSKIVDYQLRGRRLTITLEGGNIFTVTSANHPLTVGLMGPGGILQE